MHILNFQFNRLQAKRNFIIVQQKHFPSKAAKTVPSVPSVACSTPTALEWDESFKNMNDPSGRAVAKYISLLIYNFETH